MADGVNDFGSGAAQWGGIGMMTGNPFIAGGMALLGGLTNLISGNQQQQQEEARRQAAIKTLEQNIVTQPELNKMLNNVDRMFNSRLIGALNTTAITSRGLANAPVVSASVTGNIVGQEAQARLGLQTQVQQYNRQTNAQIAQIQQSGTTYSPVGAFTSGLLTALPSGMELGKYINAYDQQNKNSNQQQQPPNGNQGSLGNWGWNGPQTSTGLPSYNTTFPKPTQNPFMGKSTITNGMINNFSPITPLQQTILMGF